MLPSQKRRRESGDAKPGLTAEAQVMVIRRIVAELIRGKPKNRKDPRCELTFQSVRDDPSSILEKTVKYLAAVQHLEKALKATARF